MSSNRKRQEDVGRRLRRTSGSPDGMAKRLAEHSLKQAGLPKASEGWAARDSISGKTF